MSVTKLVPWTIMIVLVSNFAFAKKPWIIDPHTHFKGEEQIAYEATVKEWHPDNSLGKVIKPEDYRPVADRLELRSTLVVEACDQDKPEYNDWVLEQVARSELLCGYVARADLSSSEFMMQHRRYQKTGFLNGYRFRFDELNDYLNDTLARQHLTILERQGLVIDLLIEASHADDVVSLSRDFPRLKIVINHCFRAKIIDGDIGDELKRAIKKCASQKNVFCKMSSINNFSEVAPFTDPAPTDLNYYLPVLDSVYDAFGANRLIFATNWGVSAHFGSVDNVKDIVMAYLKPKGQKVVDNVMFRNAMTFYNIKRKYLR
ncbi:MAG: hypothetical protein CMJ76_15665 [Planctomycetaceae bacterium]|nr:hypothetical protein [Planctomycetaceae bacterium]